MSSDTDSKVVMIKFRRKHGKCHEGTAKVVVREWSVSSSTCHEVPIENIEKRHSFNIASQK